MLLLQSFLVFFLLLKTTVGDADEYNYNLLEAFVEARCSSASRFLRNELTAVMKIFGPTGKLVVRIYPFGKATCNTTDGVLKCDCHHGDHECTLNVLQNCVLNYTQNYPEVLDYLNCIQGKQTNATALACLKDFRHKNEVERCFYSPDGLKLMAEAGQMTPTLKFVPAVRLNGQLMERAHKFMVKTLCKHMKYVRNMPSECSKLQD